MYGLKGLYRLSSPQHHMKEISNIAYQVIIGGLSMRWYYPLLYM